MEGLSGSFPFPDENQQVGLPSFWQSAAEGREVAEVSCSKLHSKELLESCWESTDSPRYTNHWARVAVMEKQNDAPAEAYIV